MSKETLYRVWAYGYTNGLCLEDNLTEQEADKFIDDFKAKNKGISPVFKSKLFSRCKYDGKIVNI